MPEAAPCKLARYCKYSETCDHPNDEKCFQFIPLHPCGHPHACARGHAVTPSKHRVWCAMCMEAVGLATDKAVIEYIMEAENANAE